MLTARPLVQEQHAHISVRTAPQVCPTVAPTQGAPTISIGVPEQDLLMCRFANQIQGSFTAAPAVQPTSQNYQRVSSELYFRMAFPLWYLLIAHCCLPAGQELWAQLLTATLTQHSRGKMHFHRKNGFQQRPRSNLQISCLHLASSSQTSKRALPSITKQNGCTQAAMAVPSSPALLPPPSRPQPVSHTLITEPDLQPLLFHRSNASTCSPCKTAGIYFLTSNSVLWLRAKTKQPAQQDLQIPSHTVMQNSCPQNGAASSHAYLSTAEHQHCPAPLLQRAQHHQLTGL